MIARRMAESLRQSIKDAAKERHRSKVRCPQCGGLVMKTELEKTGCYFCGWKPGDETTKPKAQERKRPYRTRCTWCATINVTEQLLENGCRRCGLKPIAAESDFAWRERRERPRRERSGRELVQQLPGQGRRARSRREVRLWKRKAW